MFRVYFSVQYVGSLKLLIFMRANEIRTSSARVKITNKRVFRFSITIQLISVDLGGIYVKRLDSIQFYLSIRMNSK